MFKLFLLILFMFNIPTLHANDIPLSIIEGEKLQEDGLLNIKNVHSDIILINFWASWCGICKSEMEPLFQLIKHYKGKVSLVTIATDDDKNDSLKAYLALKNEHPLLIAQNEIYWLWDKNKEISLKRLNVNKVPETFIIRNNNNQSYQILDKIIGRYNWKSNKAYKNIDKYISK